MNQTYILKGARLSFSKDLVVPKAIKGGKPRYSANFIIDLTSPEGKAQKKELERIIADIVKTEFPGRTLEGNDLFFRNGDKLIDDKTGEPFNGYAGNAFISGARSEKKGAPAVVSRSKEKVGPMDDQFPEAGDKVNAKLNFFTINGKNDKGGDASFGKKLCCEIEVVQFVAKGEPLAGSNKPSTEGLDDLGDDEPVGALSDDEM